MARRWSDRVLRILLLVLMLGRRDGWSFGEWWFGAIARGGTINAEMESSSLGEGETARSSDMGDPGLIATGEGIGKWMSINGMLFDQG
jgi:hypothetical protein